jgi:alanyl-tRNA synthetase
MVLAQTPFYAEMGGQAGDTGTLYFGDEAIQVLDTKKENDLFIHFIDKLPNAPEAPVRAVVDSARRGDIKANHSATHLLHAALRQVLGTHVQQKGSFLDDQALRFDFAHFAKMTDAELEQVEDIVNHKIRANIQVVTKELPKEEALKLGAMALFGEKYGDIVRVVIIDPNYSVELCGGTHVGSTGEIGMFKITGESAVAAGVRRLEAVTGEGALAAVREAFGTINVLKEKIKNPQGIIAGIDKLMDENNALNKKVEALTAKHITTLKNELKGQVEMVGDIAFVAAFTDLDTADAVKKLCYDLKQDIPNLVAAISAQTGEKVTLSLLIDENLQKEKGWDARVLIKEAAAHIKGGGGGQPFFATAGGTDASGLDNAFKTIRKSLN